MTVTIHKWAVAPSLSANSVNYLAQLAGWHWMWAVEAEDNGNSTFANTSMRNGKEFARAAALLERAYHRVRKGENPGGAR